MPGGTAFKSKPARMSIRPTASVYLENEGVVHSENSVIEQTDTGGVEAAEEPGIELAALRKHHHRHHNSPHQRHHDESIHRSVLAAGSQAVWLPNVRLELKEVQNRLYNSDSESSVSHDSDSDIGFDDDNELGRAAAAAKSSYQGISDEGYTGNERENRQHQQQHHKMSRFQKLRQSIHEGKFMRSVGRGIIKRLPVRLKKTFETPARPKQDFFVGQDFNYREDEDLFSTGADVTLYKYILNYPQRIFVMMEHPMTCRFAWIYSVFISLVTLSSVLVYITSTVPEAQHNVPSCLYPACNNEALCPNRQICEPSPPEWFSIIEKNCLTIFAFDYLARLLLCVTVDPRLACIPVDCMQTRVDWRVVGKPETGEDGKPVAVFDDAAESSHDRDPDFNARSINYIVLIKISLMKMWQYASRTMNVVDLVAIIPFILELTGLAGGSTLSIVRVLRLARILRVLKLGKGSKGVQVLLATMIASLPALLILGFFSLIGVTLLGALQFFFEGGTFTVNEEYPNGAFLLVDITGAGLIETKFTSIPMAMYWSIISSTSVGFGDIVPTTYAGRTIAIIAMYGGILVLALPISVIGNNFERIYDQTKGHLSYGVVNAVLELMEDDADVDILAEMDGADVYGLRKVLVERRASKLSSVYVIAHICLKDAEAEDINLLLVKVGLRDMISALEYVYDLEFRVSQLLEFVKITAAPTPTSRDVSVRNQKVKHRLSVGIYKTGAEDEGKIDWALIEKHENKFYHSEFEILTLRAQELVRYLRKAPDDINPGYLEKYARELSESTESEIVAVPDLIDISKKSSSDVRMQKLSEVSLRVQNAYKRMQSAMQAVEIEASMKLLNSPNRKAGRSRSSISAEGLSPLRASASKAVSHTPFANIESTDGQLTPGTRYRNEATGETPLPNDAGSPVGAGAVVPPRAPAPDTHTHKGTQMHRDSIEQHELDQHPWSESPGVSPSSKADKDHPSEETFDGSLL